MESYIVHQELYTDCENIGVITKLLLEKVGNQQYSRMMPFSPDPHPINDFARGSPGRLASITVEFRPDTGPLIARHPTKNLDLLRLNEQRFHDFAVVLVVGLVPLHLFCRST